MAIDYVFCIFISLIVYEIFHVKMCPRRLEHPVFRLLFSTDFSFVGVEFLQGICCHEVQNGISLNWMTNAFIAPDVLLATYFHCKFDLN